MTLFHYKTAGKKKALDLVNKLPLSCDSRGLAGPEKDSLRAALQLFLQSNSCISLIVLLKSTEFTNSSNSLLSPHKIRWSFNTTLLTKQKGNLYPQLETLLQTNSLRIAVL